MIQNKKNSIILQQMEIGPLQNFIYFIGDPLTREIAVVDPAWDVKYLRREAKKHNYKITHIFLTHGHPDHVNGLEEMLSHHDIPVYISKHEADFYMPRCKNLHKVEDQEKLKVGAVEFTCILAPGHTPGCQCFKHDDVLISGDAVFIDGCGRCDLPGGDARVMYNTLHNIIMELPDSTIIYPGHNYGPTPYATLRSQKQTNPYLQCESEREFLEQRMGIFL